MSPRPDVHGVDLDPQTRCAHWHGALDIVALKLRCCGAYYACRDCHDALADHPARVWPRSEWGASAVLCGDRCPACAAPFNPGCKLHRHLYFEG